MKLEQIVTFSGKIHCIEGLCIGGSSNALEVGAVSKEVIKNPLTNEPYIPGSSLKGKMRSELEKKYGAKEWRKKNKNDKNDKTKILVENEKEPCGCGQSTCSICCIFGAHKNPGAKSAPTRIIVRDSVYSEEAREMIQNLIMERGYSLETKVENIVQRDTGTADSPRTIERVPAGVSFDFEIVLRIFKGDDANKYVSIVQEGLSLVEKSYLGGGGSRGSGKVKFEYEISYEQI